MTRTELEPEPERAEGVTDDEIDSWLGKDGQVWAAGPSGEMRWVNADEG